MLKTLQQTLEATPWRLLLIIGRQRGLGLNANLHKVDLVDKVGQILSEPDNLAMALATLSPSEQQALHDLLIAGGQGAGEQGSKGAGEKRGEEYNVWNESLFRVIGIWRCTSWPLRRLCKSLS